MSWDWQGNPIYTQHDDRYYTSTPQPLDKQETGIGQNGLVGNGDNGYGLQRSASGSASGSGGGSGRQTPLHSNPAPALGFYPNPNPAQNHNIPPQYFQPDYSIDPSALQGGYRPSPLQADMSTFDTSYQIQNGHQQIGQEMMDFQYPDHSVPPPRSSISSLDPNQYLQHLMYDYRNQGLNTNPGMMPDNQNNELGAQLFGNQQLYPNYPLPPLQENSAQGTISPAQLGYVNKAFSSLVMSRGSSSSASSTEGGRDWTANTTPQIGDDIQTGSNLAFQTMSHFQTQPNLHQDRTLTSNGNNGLSPETNQAIQGYFTTPNRLAYGERKLVIYTPKVGQKSYGTEKRFLCPHPLAILFGTSWWTAQGDNSPSCPIVPPSVNISLSGEEVIKDSPVNWTTVAGKDLSERINVEAIRKEEQPVLGNVAGRHLHISDNEVKRSSFTTLVRIRAPSALPSTSTGYGKTGYLGTEASEIIGTFESKEIKIISKPSKKKTNTKSTELVITHGSTIALYSRTKSQTASTRYLSIEPDLTNIRGSDGQHFPGASPPKTSSTLRKEFPGLISSASVWESFIIWLADPFKPAGPSDLPPLQPDWPSQPNNALITGPVPPPIRYNALVILQSTISGHCTPVMTIRRIDQDTDAVGHDGVVSDSSLGYTPEGEMLGDMVAQVQKIGMEIYNPVLSNQLAVNRYSGDSSWLACDHENIIARHVQSERRWAPIPIPYRGGKSHSTPTTPARGFHILPMTPHTSSTNLPSTPSSPTSITFSSSSSDYFGPNSRKSSSTHLISPISSNGEQLPMVHMSNSNDGGAFRRPRTGSTGRMGPLGRPPHRKRQSTDSHGNGLTHGLTSGSSSYDHLPNALGIIEQRQSWALSIGDVAVWTIVGTEQTSYTFYVPPTISVQDNPIAPYPVVTKYLPPGAETKDARTEVGFTPQTDLPLVHLYGKGFSKLADGPKYDVYYGNTKARHVEARCEECMAVSEPEHSIPRPCTITLVRKDGRSIIPTGLVYDHPPTQPTQTHNVKQQQYQ